MKLSIKAIAVAFSLAIAAQFTHAEDFKVTGLTFSKPKTWTKVAPGSSMRKAQLEIRDGDNKAEVVFFYFGPGGAGGVDANVTRWLRQFKEPKEKLNPKIESQKVGSTKVTFVRAEGTYMSGAPFGPKTPVADSMMFASILEAQQGPIFVKMTGPKKIVSGAVKDMRKMIEDALK